MLTCIASYTESQLGDILLALKEVTRPYQLGIYLDIETYELDRIKVNHPHDVEQRMTEVIKYWLCNRECSWEVLASAVEKMGGH